jgi:hypothetical protein
MIKVDEIKDDAIVSIKVNKAYYLMVKALSLKLIHDLKMDNETAIAYLKEGASKKYEDMDDHQRGIRTTALLIAEIETQAKAQGQTDEKEILEPNDEGYIAPTVD